MRRARENCRQASILLLSCLSALRFCLSSTSFPNFVFPRRIDKRTSPVECLAMDTSSLFYSVLRCLMRQWVFLQLMTAVQLDLFGHDMPRKHLPFGKTFGWDDSSQLIRYLWSKWRGSLVSWHYYSYIRREYRYRLSWLRPFQDWREKISRGGSTLATIVYRKRFYLDHHGDIGLDGDHATFHALAFSFQHSRIIIRLERNSLASTLMTEYR